MPTHKLECKLQSRIDSIYNWFAMNKFGIKKEYSVMFIGSKVQLRSLNRDNFAISAYADKLLPVE